MLHWWPHTEPADGLELVVCRPFAFGPVAYAAGDAFPYRDLGIAFETVRTWCAIGQLRIANLQATATRRIEWGAHVFVAGDVVPFVELAIPVTTLRGLEINGSIRFGLGPHAVAGEPEAPPAPKVGGKVDRGASGRQRSARA